MLWCSLLITEKTADEFNLYMKKFPDLYEYLALLVKKYSSSPHPIIVDLGCGSGLLSVMLLSKMPHALVVGIDPLRKMLQLAKDNIASASAHGFEPTLGVSEKLPLQSSSVDVIVSRFSLPYWKEPLVSFSEMHQVLKPQGFVVLEGLNKEFPRWKLAAIKMHMLWNRAGRDVTKYHVDAYKTAHTIEQVVGFFNTTGFRILTMEGKKNEWRFIVIAQKQ